MKEIIQQVLKDMSGRYGNTAFSNATRFKNSIVDILGYMGIDSSEAKRIRNLLNIAIVDMQAYTKLKTAIEKKEFYVIGNLIKEMDSDYAINREAAEIVMNCIAEWFGYVAPNATTQKEENITITQPNNVTIATPPPVNTQVSTSSNILFCGQCGKANDGANQFCSFCGAGISIPSQSHVPNKPISIAPPAIFSDYSFGGHEWIVLKVENGKVLLLRKHIWGKRPYHRPDEDVTWEKCTLRKELKDEFYNQIPQTERSRIIETLNLNSNNPWFGNPFDNPFSSMDTQDYVFLLSLDEVVECFGDSGMLKKDMNESERTQDYDKDWSAHGMYFWGFHDKYSEKRIAKDASGEAYWWWLRSPGDSSIRAAAVGSVGGVDMIGIRTDATGGVRPALWLNL